MENGERSQLKNENGSTENKDVDRDTSKAILPYIMVYRQSSNELFYSVYNSGQNWGSPQRVQYQGQSILSPEDPSLAEWGGTLYLHFVGSDKQMYRSTFDGQFWSRPDVIYSGYKAAFTPAMTVLNGSIIMAWKGPNPSDQQIYFANPTAHPIVKIIPHVGTMSSPYLTTYNGRVMMAWKGTGRDNGIWYMFPEVQGASQQGLAAFQTAHGPRLTTYSGMVVMFWYGVGDDKIWYSSYTDPDGWAPQNEAVDGNAICPAAITNHFDTQGSWLLMAWTRTHGVPKHQRQPNYICVVYHYDANALEINGRRQRGRHVMWLPCLMHLPHSLLQSLKR